MQARVPSTLSLITAVVLQLGAAAELGGYRRSAIWLAAAAVAIVVWQYFRKRSKVFLVILNAIILTLPVPHYFGSGHGDGRGRDAGDPLQIKDPKPTYAGGGAAIVADKTFPGVILFPEPKEHVTLVPPLPSMRQNVFAPGQHDPLDIPFFGSYWLFKYPETRLPKTAITMRGDPDSKTFRSTDLTPMRMEAHQNLGTFFNLDCCRAVEIVVRNADRYPGSVEVELTLVNTEEHGVQTLGSVPVTSTPRWRPGGREVPSETLTFPIPDSPAIQRFDEFSIRFLLGHLRSDHSAGIAVERFVLMPRI
jgi:hypothetical protein